MVPTVRRTVEPIIVIAVGVYGVSPTKTVKALRDGVGEVTRDSLRETVTVLPLPATEVTVGGTRSGPAVDKLVADVADKESTSFPDASWFARFVGSAFVVGAV